MSIPSVMEVRQYKLRGLNKVNILVGKNGCGKSTALRFFEEQISVSSGAPFSVKRYISPERGGMVSYEANVDNNISSSPDWLNSTRRANQANQFRQQSFALFRKLELEVLRLIEKERRTDHTFTFDNYVNDINGLLDQVKLNRAGAALEIRSRANSEVLTPEKISSGESELISLAIECLSFESNTVSGTNSLLMLDEPDVHLHPDLQARLMDFLCKIVERSGVVVIMSTHSTPILGALSKRDYARICFMKYGDKNLVFQNIGDVLRSLIPIFGAHPLSAVFNENPVLIVEGEDEERIWQQAVRTSCGKIRLYPVSCGGKAKIAPFEIEAESIISSVYDTARGYSLRDGDGITEELQDTAHLTRLRLNCYASENLMLSDEVLGLLQMTWNDLKNRIGMWHSTSTTHPYAADVGNFISCGFDRRNHNIKTIRNVLLSLLPTNKPWEVLVGQSLSGMFADPSKFQTEGSILQFLGEKTAVALLPERL